MYLYSARKKKCKWFLNWRMRVEASFINAMNGEGGVSIPVMILTVNLHDKWERYRKRLRVHGWTCCMTTESKLMLIPYDDYPHWINVIITKDQNRFNFPLKMIVRAPTHTRACAHHVSFIVWRQTKAEARKLLKNAHIEMKAKANKRKLKSNSRLWGVNSTKWNSVQRMRWKCNSFMFVAKIEYENVHSLWQYWISDSVHIRILAFASKHANAYGMCCFYVCLAISVWIVLFFTCARLCSIHLLHDISLWRNIPLFQLLRSTSVCLMWEY